LGILQIFKSILGFSQGSDELNIWE